MKAYETLANAIIIQAAKDYMKALRYNDKPRLEEIETFFNSEWFTMLSRTSPYKLTQKLKEKEKNRRLEKMLERISYQNHDEWLELRKSGIGGSDAAAVIGLSPYKAAYDVYADKLGLVPPVEDNEAMRLGRDLEEYIASRFCEAAGKKVRRRNYMLRNHEYPFAIADIDREIVGERAGLECKTTNILNLKRYKNGDFPEEYYTQCVHYLMVTGFDRWYLAVYIFGKGLEIFVIDRDEDEIKALADRERDFWKNNILKKQPPAFTGLSSEDRTLNALYPESNSGKVDLMPFANELRQYTSRKEMIKQLTAQNKAVEQSIKEYMQTAAQADTDGYKVTWKEQTRSSWDVDKLIKDFVPSGTDLDEYKKETVTRVFKVKEIKK